jgi:hypothetical protein
MRKTDERGFIVPTYGQLFSRLICAVEKLEPTRAALIAIRWERWNQNQPPWRFIRKAA